MAKFFKYVLSLMLYFRLQGTIHNVVEPTLPANGFDSPPKSTNNLKSPENKSVKSGKTPSKSNAMVVLSDDEGTSKKSSCTSPTNSMKKSVWPDAKNYEYLVKVKRTKSTHEDLTIKGSCIRYVNISNMLIGGIEIMHN